MCVSWHCLILFFSNLPEEYIIWFFLENDNSDIYNDESDENGEDEEEEDWDERFT